MKIDNLTFQADLDSMAEKMTKIAIDIEFCLIDEPFDEYPDLYPELFEVMIGDYHEALKKVVDTADSDTVYAYVHYSEMALAVDVLCWHQSGGKECATLSPYIARALERLGQFIELPKLNESDGSIAYKGDVYPRIKK